MEHLSSHKSEEKRKSSSGSNNDDKESKELNYDEDEDQLEKRQNEIREITVTTNQVF
ncbi:MAG: hypothetical protein ACJ71G_07870 [Nitrososphaeraceae archaeon]